MRVLIYGFGPYPPFRDNITAKLIKSLPQSPDQVAKIFPVRFHRQQFVAALNRYRPDIILGLGQCSGRQIAVETRARNQRRAGKSAKVRVISKDRPKYLSTSLSIRARGALRSSANAGDYVCNYSMYVLLDAIGRARRKVLFGFIHIPYDCKLDKAVRVVRSVLRQYGRAG